MAISITNSGATALSTSSDTAENVLLAQNHQGQYAGLCVKNEGSVAGFFDPGDGNYRRLSAYETVMLDTNRHIGPVYVKRVGSGSNVTGIWAYRY